MTPPAPIYDKDGICPNCGVAESDRNRLLGHDEEDDLCTRCGHSSESHGGGDEDGEYPDLPCGECDCDRWSDEEQDNLEEDPDAPDDGKVLVAGVLYDRETGMEADPQ
jgi:hypothetical protein